MKYVSIAAAVLVTFGNSTIAVGQPVAFSECPIFRDVHQMRACWLAEYKGDLYYLGSPGGVLDNGSLPPQLKHRALVEGAITNEPRVCGGIVLKPVKVSPLAEIDEHCNKVLPAAGYTIPAFEPARGIPNTDLLTPPPKPPFTSRTMTVGFYFDTAFLSIPSLLQVQAAAVYAVTAKPKQVIVRGYRGATSLSDGRQMVEQLSISETRANKIAASLIDLGVARELIKVEWISEPRKGDGIQAPDLRAAEIEMVM